MRRPNGLTLVELLISIALMTILTGSVVFVFIQAQNIYTHVDAKVAVYQNARMALDWMERDLANVVRTIDMEFFNDTKGPQISAGHYFQGANEEIPIAGAEDADSIYNFATTLREPRPYIGVDKAEHRHDSVYFKTITTVPVKKPTDPQTAVAALIEYALEDMNKERPKLVRRVWHVTGFDASANPPKLVINGNTTSAQPDKMDLCHYVVDCRFSFYLMNKRTGAGGSYCSASEAVGPPKVPPDFTEYAFPPMRNVWNSPDFEIMSYYDVYHAGPGIPDLGIMEKDEEGLFHTQNDFLFPMLAPGDKIFLSEADDISSPQAPFPPGDFTIKKIDVDKKRIEFIEPISLVSLGGGTKPRTVHLFYRAGFLPPAVRCVLKIKDAKAKELRTISRTFKVLSS